MTRVHRQWSGSSNYASRMKTKKYLAQARNCDEEGRTKTYSIGRSAQTEAALRELELFEGVWKVGVAAEITRIFNEDLAEAKQLAGNVEKRSRGRKGKAKAAAATNGDDNGNSLRKRKAEAVKESVPDQVGSDITLSLFLSLYLPPGHHRLGHCLVSYDTQCHTPLIVCAAFLIATTHYRSMRKPTPRARSARSARSTPSSPLARHLTQGWTCSTSQRLMKI